MENHELDGLSELQEPSLTIRPIGSVTIDIRYPVPAEPLMIVRVRFLRLLPCKISSTNPYQVRFRERFLILWV
jgi:hypothetical protein